MPKIPTIIPVSDLRQDAASLLSELRDSNEPMFITQRGRAAAVLIGIDAYQRSEE
jgi:prevent-host-death family protein